MWNAEWKGELNSAFRTPPSALAVKHRRLLWRGPRRCEPKVTICCGGCTAAPRRACEESLLHQEGLMRLFEWPRIIADSRSDRGHANRSAVELLDDGLENPRVHVIETE